MLAKEQNNILSKLPKKQYQPLPKGARVAVMGAGRSGIAALRLLLSLEHKVCLLEQNAQNIKPELEKELQSLGVKIICGEHNQEQFTDIDYIIPSPGIAVSSILPILPAQNTPIILAELELAYRYLQNEPIIAITGTSGKTTTASLTAAMLKAQGYEVFLGGNIGTPLSEYVLNKSKADVLVLEVSSFQLQTCKSFSPNVAMLLNITENHLDYHKDMQEYIDAKLEIFKQQEACDIAIVHNTLKELMQKNTMQSKLVYFEKGENRFSECRLVGAHNEANIEAAWLACKELGVSEKNAARAVAEFAPLEHRLESVRELMGVLYVNDSKCTTPSSMKVALEAFDRPIILLCGGKFKGGDLEGLRPLIQKKVKHVAMFGAGRNYFEKAWQDTVPMTWSENLENAINIANEHAVPGDVILMAPATSSFDLYKHYMARGDDFKRLVEALS